jgi:hypothetical protein
MTMSRPDEQAIKDRAHALWEAEGRPAGRAHDHWVQAEQELDAAGPDRDPSAAELTQQQSDGIDGGDLQGTQSSPNVLAKDPSPRRKATIKS